MADLSLSLFGPFKATLNGEPLPSFRTIKVQALLIYLVTEAGRAHGREALMELLWPGLPLESAQINLRQTLFRLRKMIPELSTTGVESGGKSRAPFVISNRRTVQINPEVVFNLDVDRFEKLINKSRFHDHAKLITCHECLERLSRAVELYRGPFLADFYLTDSNDFEDWATGKRESYRRQALDVLDTLTAVNLQQGDFAGAQAYARRQIELDDLDERAYRHLFEALARNGQRNEALAEYDKLRELLAEEMGMEPADRTTKIMESIQAGDLAFKAKVDVDIRGYELKMKIGAGAMGTIHLAVQPGIGREVAVKVIRSQYADDPEFIRRFETEAQIIARLEHPYIVPLYDYWRDPKGAYLVMRYLRGGNLLSTLDDGPWSPEAAARMLDQIAAALNSAHQQGVIHRDIKPANILLDKEGNSYLTDFGIAKDLSVSANLTAANAVLGTLDYVSPEQILNEPVTGQTDIYSLGAVLYQTLTGKKPYSNSSIASLLHSHLKEPVPPVLSSRMDLPARIDEVIQRATAKRPADRYASVLEMASAYRSAISGTDRGLRLPSISPPEDLYNPYKGLRAFQESDSADFYGREALVTQLISQMADTRFLAVVGPSGSGKSSIVKAGLIPRLRQGALQGSDKWHVAQMVPGNHPLEELELALWPIAVDPPPSLVEPMQRDSRGMLRTIRRILPDEDGAQLLLVIDQFEELFTMVEDEERRNHFLDSLLAAITEPRTPLRVIVTLRADFYDRPLSYPAIADLFKQHTGLVLPLNRDELTSAIQEPALRVGVTFEDGVVAAMVADVNNQPGALPLVQYALTELFEARQNNVITNQAYDDVGGVLAALARRADDIYDQLSPQEKISARQLFLRLVTLGEGVEDTRRRVLRSELEALQTSRTLESSEVFDGVVDAFGRARLLTFDHDPMTRGSTVEVAHEALLREWSQLRRWLDESRTDIRLQRSLATSLAEWLAAGQDDGYLLRGARLSRFEAWQQETGLSLTSSEQRFLDASLRARRQRREKEEARRQRELETAQNLAESERQRAEEQARAAGEMRRRAYLLVGALAIALVLAIVALFAGRQANKNATIAERSAAESQSLALASGAQAALLNNETDQALALALAANRIEDPPAFAQQMVYEAALAPGTLQRIDGGGLFRWPMDLHPDGGVVASGADDGSITLWDVNTGEEIIRLEGVHSDSIGGIRFTPDGRHLLSGAFDDLLVLWDIETGEVIRSMRNPSGDVNSVDVSPDGKMAIAGTQFFGVATLWDLETGEQIGELAGHDPDLQLQPVVFSPDGRLAATGSEDASIILWDVADQTLLNRLEKHSDIVFALAFSPDGKTLASGSFDNDIIIWDVASGEPISTLNGHTDFVFDVAFNSDGSQLLSSSRDQSVILWDVVSGEPLRTYQGEAGRILSIAFLDDERGISTASTGNLRQWALDNEMVLEKFRLTDDFMPSFALNEESRLAAAGLFEEIRLLDLENGEFIGSFEPTGGDITSLAFDRAGERLLSGSDDGTIILWDVRQEREIDRFEGHTTRIHELAFSPDGGQFLSASDDKSMILWDLESGDIVFRFSSPTDTINAVAFSPDGRTLAGGFGTFRYVIEGDYQDNSIRLWDAGSGEEIRQMTGHEGPVTALRFSPDGHTLLSGSIDETVHLWDVETGDQLRRFDGHTGGVFDVAFSPDGEYAASGAADAAVIVWHVGSGDRLRHLRGHEGVVHRVSFEQEGDGLWSAAEDGQAILWNLSLDLQELLDWAEANRYVPEFTCNQRAQYNIEPFCEAGE